MKKGKVIITGLILSIIVGCITIYNIISPRIKGLHGGRGVINYKGQTGIMESFFPDFTEAKFLGRTEDKDFKVYGYGNGRNYNLVTLVGSDNTDSYNLGGFKIPTTGEVTKVFLDPGIRAGSNKVTKKQRDIEMFKKLADYKGEEDTWHIDNIYTDGAEICFAYNDCPVTTYENLVLYIAYVENSWIIVTPESYKKDVHNNKTNEADFIGMKITNQELIQWLEENKSTIL